jgi:hypothetical protein
MPHEHEHAAHALHLGTACEPRDAGVLVHAVCLFGLYPFALLVFNFLFVALSSDIFFALLSKIVLFLAVRYARIAAELLHVERDASFDYRYCHADRYVYPDALYVTSMVYTLTIIYAFWTDIAFRRRYFTWWNCALFGGIVVLYAASTIVSGYFTWTQLVVNSAIVLGTSLLLTMLYRYAVLLYLSEAAHNRNNIVARLTRFLGLSVAMFVPARLQRAQRRMREESQIFAAPSDS